MLIEQEVQGGNLILTSDNMSGDWDAMNSFPAFKKWKGRKMLVRPVGANFCHIVAHWKTANWVGLAKDTYDEFLMREMDNMMTAIEKENMSYTDEDDDYVYGRKPKPYQRDAFRLSRDKKLFGLFMRQGTGKTKVTIDTAAYLYKKGEIDMLLVLSWPKGVHRNWIDPELPKDMPSWCEHDAFYWPNKYNKTVAARIKEFSEKKDCLRVASFNIECLDGKDAKATLEYLLDNNRCLFVIDQSAAIKSPNGKRTTYVVDTLSHKAEYKRILDGDPSCEGTEELYSQFKFMDKNIIGHDTWTGFKNEFCKVGRWNEICGYRNLEELYRRIDGYCLRLHEDEHLNLPPRIYRRWKFDLGKNERRIYNEMNAKRTAYFAEEDGSFEKTEEKLAMIKNMRLQQISSGFFKGKEGLRQIEEIPTRLMALQQLLKQAPGKSIIFAKFRSDLALISHLLGEEAVGYYGGIEEEHREEGKKRFMNDPKIKYFVGHPKTAGIGHTLTAASNVVFYSNEYSLRMREECEKRAHRIGIEETVGKDGSLLIWDLIAHNTTDEKIIEALQGKKILSEMIMRDPESFFLIEEEDQ